MQVGAQGKHEHLSEVDFLLREDGGRQIDSRKRFAPIEDHGIKGWSIPVRTEFNCDDKNVGYPGQKYMSSGDLHSLARGKVQDVIIITPAEIGMVVVTFLLELFLRPLRTDLTTARTVSGCSGRSHYWAP